MHLALLIALASATHSTQERVVLKSWMSSAGDVVELLVEPCKLKGENLRCQIALKVPGPPQRGKFSNRVDLFELEVHGKTYDASPVDDGVMLSSDYEYGSQHITVTTGKLSPKVDAILVHRLAGFDHLYDTFVAFAQHGSKLQQVWNHESAMPRDAGITSAELRDTNGDGMVELLSETVLTYELEDDKGAEAWSGTAHSWRSLKGFQKLSVPVFASIAGSYRTTKEAVNARKANECLQDYLVLNSSAHPMLKPGWKVLAKMTWVRDEATAWSKTVQEDCKTDAYVRRAH